MKKKKPQVPTIPVYIYFVAFEPPVNGVGSMIWHIPKILDKSDDLRKIEAVLNKDQHSLLTPHMPPRERVRVTNVSLLHEARRQLMPGEVEELRRAVSVKQGVEEVMREAKEPSADQLKES